MWIFYLNQKSEAFDFFSRFKAQAENTFGVNIKAIRSDMGGKFLSTQFKTLCEDTGIRRELIAPGSPQQNGVVERHNRNIVEMVRTMLIHKYCPKFLWAEAASTTMHILNRVPTKPKRHHII